MRTRLWDFVLRRLWVVIVIAVVGGSPSTGLSYDWIVNPANGHDYSLTEGDYYGIGDGCPSADGSYGPACSTLTWVEAQGEAALQGGYLTAISDSAENGWLISTFGEDDEYWIGLTDHGLYSAEGVWVWVNGEPVTFLYWGYTEPNNNNVGGEDCAHINHLCCHGICCDEPRRGTWNDLGNDPTFYEGRHPLPHRGIIERTRGACCMPDGACLDGQLDGDCAALGGVWLSDQSCAEMECVNATESTTWGRIKAIHRR